MGPGDGGTGGGLGAAVRPGGGGGAGPGLARGRGPGKAASGRVPSPPQLCPPEEHGTKLRWVPQPRGPGPSTQGPADPSLVRAGRPWGGGPPR